MSDGAKQNLIEKVVLAWDYGGDFTYHVYHLSYSLSIIAIISNTTPYLLLILEQEFSYAMIQHVKFISCTHSWVVFQNYSFRNNIKIEGHN